MMKSMSFERLSEMAGDLAPEGFVESVNAKLIQIKKHNHLEGEECHGKNKSIFSSGIWNER